MSRAEYLYPDLKSKLKAVADKATEVREAATEWREGSQQKLGGLTIAEILRTRARELAEIATHPTPNPRPAVKDTEARFYTIAEMRKMGILK